MPIVIDDALIKALLLEGEGAGLDFKRDQYRFIKATDEEKAELLKDILAFANAWRRSDAFVLIGIEEIKGGKNLVVGTSDHLDDAAIQQFVNQKTQRPIDFSYCTYTFEGKAIGVIHIPQQERPLYLNKDFGKLKANTVYVRRGSSTDEADLDEIARMGASLSVEAKIPQLEVFFSNPATREKAAQTPVLKGVLLQVQDDDSIPDYEESTSNPFGSSLFGFPNRDYYRELVTYTKARTQLQPVHLAIANVSEVTAIDVRLEIEIDDVDNCLSLLDRYDYPPIPSRRHETTSYIERINRQDPEYDISVMRIGTNWLISGKIEKVQPRATHWFQHPFFIGSSASKEIALGLSVFADNLGKPHTQLLQIQCDVEHLQIDLAGVEKLEHERFISSPTYKRLLERAKKGV